MADAHDDSWTPLRDKIVERAPRIPTNVGAQLEEAERRTLDEICNGKLEVRGRDADGRKCMGISGWLVWSLRYDWHADCLREHVPGGRALYQPEVRERRQRDRPSAPVHAAKHDESDGDDKRDGWVDELNDEAVSPVSSDDRAVSETRGELGVTESADTASLSAEVMPTATPRRWPWVETPDPVGPTSQIARCRKDLVRHFQPSDILDLTAPEIQEELSRKGCNYTIVSIKRTLLRKKDRLAKVNPSEPK